MLTPSAIPVGPSGQARARDGRNGEDEAERAAAMSAALKEPQANRRLAQHLRHRREGQAEAERHEHQGGALRVGGLEGAALEQDARSWAGPG